MIALRIAAVAYIVVSALLISISVRAKDIVDEPVILVATPALRDALFGASILIVKPIGNRQHMGFIINRPTGLKLSELLPDHKPSREVSHPIYIGGPESVASLFVLVQRPANIDNSGLRFASDLYLEVERNKVDRVIQNELDQARFFAGVVIWQTGELDAEIQHDFWYVQDADAELVLRKTTAGLWEELVRRIQRNKNAITADSNSSAIR